MPTVRAVLDTNVLWPNYLRCTLLRLGHPDLGLYEPLWSNRILDDLGRTLRERRGLTADAWERLRALMREAFPDASQDPPNELIDQMSNNREDRHVLAAAVAGRAGHLVTWNVDHFPSEACLPWGIEVTTPDAFLLVLYRQSATDVLDSRASQVAQYRREPRTMAGLFERLHRSRIEAFGHAVEEECDMRDLERRVEHYREASD